MYEKKIVAFGRNMAQQFAANESRGGWRSRDPKDNEVYIQEMRDTVAKLYVAAIHGQHEPGTTAQEHEAVIRELTADLANLALIVAENCNCIQYTDEEMGIMG